MHIVGLTGGIGSGKSMAALFFKELNVPVIDLDDIAKEITTKNNEGYNEIVKKFGVRYLNDKKEINRYLIKAEIFNDPKLKKEFEQLIHPLIYTACLNQIDNFHTQTYLILIVPLLFETKTYLGLIQESLLIDCKISTQKERVFSRDKLDSKLIDKIIASQLERSERQEKADNIITNDGSVDELKQKIKIFHDNIIKRLQND